MGRKNEAQSVKCAHRLGQNVVDLRQKRDLTQAATAERAGLDRTEVSLIERGKRVPRLETIVKLAGALQVEPCALLEGMAWELDPPKEGSK